MRFAEPAEEREYRRWRGASARRYAQIAALVASAAAWVLPGLAAALWFPDLFRRTPAWVLALAGAVAVGALFAVHRALERSLREVFASARLAGRQRASLLRFVPVSVVERIEAGDGAASDAPRRAMATVLSAGIAGFTGIADRLPVNLFARLLREYTGELRRIVERHGGTLDDFAGGGVLAVFATPPDNPAQQVRNAVAAARALAPALVSFNRAWLEAGLPAPVQARIGINTGELALGSFGAQGRMTYTAIGLQANLASRIQALCEPGGVLLSDASWQLVKDEIACEPRGEAQVKGVHFPVALYSVRPGGSFSGSTEAGASKDATGNAQ